MIPQKEPLTNEKGASCAQENNSRPPPQGKRAARSRQSGMIQRQVTGPASIYCFFPGFGKEPTYCNRLNCPSGNK
jgi:hypothetical protein